MAAQLHVGVVDSSLVSQENWVAPWKSEWQSSKIVDRLNAAGVKADVIGVDILLNPSVLANYNAIVMPTDECYPDEGSRNGPVSKNIANFVRLGGTYFMPLGAGHCRWRDIRTGAMGSGYQSGEEDFLGLLWESYGGHEGDGPELKLTDDGQSIGIPAPAFTRPMNTHCRGVQQPGLIYVRNTEKQRCLYAVGVGKGAVVHYTGGLPLDAQLRDWLIDSYAAIVKTGGPDLTKINREVLLNMRTYDVYPVSKRAAAGAQSSEISLDGNWEMAEATNEFSGDIGDLSSLKWTTVGLPDSIHGALWRSGQIENPWYGQNWKNLQWIAERDWYLRKTVTVPANWKDRHIRLRFDGANYKCALWVDGEFQGSHEGMYGGPTVDVSRLVSTGGKHEVVVRLFHETDLENDFKSNAMKGGDSWANKYRTMGLYQSVRLIGTGGTYLEAPYVRTEKIAGASATLWAQASLINMTSSGFEGVIDASIVDTTTGKTVFKKTYRQSVPKGTSYWEQHITVKEPKLWWPNGMGSQPLYRLDLSVSDGAATFDSIGTRFGMRTLELARNPYLPNKPRSTPGTPAFIAAKPQFGAPGSASNWNRPDLWSGDHPLEDEAMQESDEGERFLFVVNGKPVYGKGVCWMTSDDTLSISQPRESWMIRAAKNAGVNLFRLNGGNCIFETEEFFNLCDENGILVWQDLPMFCWSRGTRVPLRTWREQMKQSVLRLRQHPSLAVYVGGNEFAPYVEALAPYLGMAREVIASYDDRPFRMGSPCGGTYHAYYSPAGSFEDLWNGDPNWYVKYFDESVNFVSEWSYVCYANMSLLKRIVPAEELTDEPVGFDSLAFLKKHPTIYSRLIEPDRIRDMLHAKISYYDNLERTKLPQFIEYSQMVEGETYGYVFEHWRSQLPYKGGETVWTYNSHGPSSSWSIIDWFGQPQAPYYSVQRAHEGVHVMADISFFSWGPGDKFRASVFALNDGFSALKNTTVRARLLDVNFREITGKTWKLDIPALGSKSQAREISWQIPPTTPEGYFFVELTLSDALGARLSRQSYNIRVTNLLADPEARRKWQSGAVNEHLTKTGPWLRPQIERAKTQLKCQLISAKPRGSEADVVMKITNTGSKPAYPVTLTLNRDQYSSVWSDGYFWLCPGETVIISGTIKLDMTGIDTVQSTPVAKLSDLAVTVSSWNAVSQSVSLAK